MTRHTIVFTSLLACCFLGLDGYGQVPIASLNPISDGDFQISAPFSNASLGSSDELLLDISFLTFASDSSGLIFMVLDYGAIDVLTVELGDIEAGVFVPGSAVADLSALTMLAGAQSPLFGVDEAVITGLQGTQALFSVEFVAPDAGQNDFVVRLAGSQTRAIPEPATGVILACGALALLGRRRRRARGNPLSR